MCRRIQQTSGERDFVSSGQLLDRITCTDEMIAAGMRQHGNRIWKKSRKDRTKRAIVEDQTDRKEFDCREMPI